jgi:hypothetical protein
MTLHRLRKILKTLESQKRPVMLSNMMRSQSRTKPILRRSQTLRMTLKMKIKELLKCNKQMRKFKTKKPQETTRRVMSKKLKMAPRKRKAKVMKRFQRIKMLMPRKVTMPKVKKLQETMMNKLMMRLPRKEMLKMVTKTWKMTRMRMMAKIKDQLKSKITKTEVMTNKMMKK